MGDQGQERDTNQPTNVLEMMKMWKDELKHDSGDVDGSDEADLSDCVDANSLSPGRQGGRKKSGRGATTDKVCRID